MSARAAFWWTTAGVLGAWALHNALLLPLENAHLAGPWLVPLQLALRAVVWMVPAVLYLRRFAPEPTLAELGVTSPIDRRGLLVAAPPAVAYLLLAAVLARLSPPQASRPAAATVLIGAALEELLLRGFVLRQALRWSTPRRAQAITALLYAAMHLPGWIALDGLHAGLVPSFTVLLVQGAVLGYVAFRSRSTLPAIAVHFANNLLGR